MCHPATGPFEFQLCFRCLPPDGQGPSCHGFTFPCDRQGRVDMDRLSERVRNNYLFARAMVGRDLATPAIEPAGMAGQTGL